jgi:hypothetical protein
MDNIEETKPKSKYRILEKGCLFYPQEKRWWGWSSIVGENPDIGFLGHAYTHKFESLEKAERAIRVYIYCKQIPKPPKKIIHEYKPNH